MAQNKIKIYAMSVLVLILSLPMAAMEEKKNEDKTPKNILRLAFTRVVALGKALYSSYKAYEQNNNCYYLHDALEEAMTIEEVYNHIDSLHSNNVKLLNVRNNGETLLDRLIPWDADPTRDEFNVIKKLLEKGASTNIVDKQGKTPLLRIIESRGNYRGYGVGTVKLLLDNNGNANSADEVGNRPLAMALDRYHFRGTYHKKIIELLLKRNADPNLPDPFGRYLLHEVALSANISITQLLLNYKANPNVFYYERVSKDNNLEDNERVYPLQLLVRRSESLKYDNLPTKDKLECMKLFIEAGANPQFEKHTILHEIAHNTKASEIVDFCAGIRAMPKAKVAHVTTMMCMLMMHKRKSSLFYQLPKVIILGPFCYFLQIPTKFSAVPAGEDKAFLAQKNNNGSTAGYSMILFGEDKEFFANKDSHGNTAADICLMRAHSPTRSESHKYCFLKAAELLDPN